MRQLCRFVITLQSKQLDALRLPESRGRCGKKPQDSVFSVAAMGSVSLLYSRFEYAPGTQ